MRRGLSNGSGSRRQRRGFGALVALVVTVGLGLAAGPSASADSAWTGSSGPGTTTVVTDGTSGPATFTYNYDPTPGVDGLGVSLTSWTFQTTAAASDQVQLNWAYSGFHAYFQVTAGLSAFVSHGETTTTTPLVTAGPANCCTTPSGGFSYSGTTTLTVSAGDTYGFTMSGSNFDSNDVLQGTLTVTRPASPAPPPVLFGAVPDAQPGKLGVAGLVDGGAVPAGTAYQVSVYASSTCQASEPALLGTRTITTNANGVAAFAIDDFTNVAAGQWVWATARRPSDGAIGPPSPPSNCVRAGPNNTSWPTALALAPTSAKTGFLQAQGEGRWFKVPILPNSRVNISLSGLPADYDLIVFNDIQAAYDALSAGASSPSGPGLALDDLAKQGAETPNDAFNTSQYNPSAWDPTNWDPSLNTSVFSPSQWSPSQWSPSQWSASLWAPSQWSPSQWSPSQWSPSQWSPSQWSPSQWSPSQWSPSQWSASFPSDPQLFSSAQTASLLAVSAGTGTGDESVSVNTWNNTGFFYVRVQGKNGSFDPDQDFTLSVQRDGNVCQGVADQASTPSAPAGNRRTVVLTDSSRMSIGSTLAGKLTELAGRPEVNGVVVDVNGDPVVRSLNAQADSHRGCPYAKNLVASAIKRIVDAYRATNPIEYVVAVGDDSVIPFFRYADPSLLGNETLYSPPVKDDSASQASLRLGYVLNQDGYGSSEAVSLHGNKFPIPDLAVGRLVETPAEILGLLNAYLDGTTGGVVPTPTSSLVTGYDFLQDAADEVKDNLGAGIGTPSDTLITDQSVSPALVTQNGTPSRSRSWTAVDLRTKLLGPARHDLVFLAGHFSANDALAADYKTSVFSTELASATTDFVNAIVFSAGCHSGYNIVNGDAIANVTEPLDWAQAFARKKATLIAGTGYQYGDTDFLAYSERIYAELSRQLRLTSDPLGGRVPVSVGKALLRSKRNYLKTTPGLSALDEKALLEATLFGLPMLSVDLPSGRIYEAPDATTIGSLTAVGIGPGQLLGLRFADTGVGNAGVAPQSLQLSDGPLATYFTGPDGVTVVPTQPILPLVSRNVTAPASPAGYIVRGVGFRGGSYVDTNGVTPLTAASATELRGIHAPFFTDVFFPVQPWTTNYFDAIGGGGTTRLMVTPVQHKSDTPLTSTRRAFSNLDFRLFYSNNLSVAALAAAPTITGVETSFGSGTLTLRARVVGDIAAGIQGVWVTWTIPPGAGGGGVWQSLDLQRDAGDPTLWTGTLPVGSPGNLLFMVQAVNGAGRVTLDANVGAFYRPGSIPGVGGGAQPPAPTTMAFEQPPPSTVKYGDEFTVKARLTGVAPLQGKLVRIGFGSAGVPAFTDGDGVATVKLRAALTPGTYKVTASFAGDAEHAASDTSGDVEVNALGTTLQLSGTLGPRTIGSPLSIVATLTDAGTPPGPLERRKVFVIIKGTGPASAGVTRVSSGDTGPDGRVAVAASILAGLPVGNYTVDAYFNGAPAPVGLPPDDVDYASSEDHATLSLQWPFTGFIQPVDNPPTLNTVKAGSAVPVKFSLGGDRGLGILAGGAPVVTTLTCPGSAPVDEIETPATTNSGLTYDATSKQYTYVWKTAKSSAGCSQLNVKLVDGTDHVALFKFK